MIIRESALQRPRLPESHYVDNRIYTDPVIFEEERRRIFARVWNFVCLEAEVPSPGDFRTTSVAGVPLIIVRGREGGVRAFDNVCRHRSMPVAREEAGNCGAFRCIYHLWTYDLDGRLIGVTLPEGYEGTGFRKEDFGLVEARCETIGGMVFVCLSPDTEPLRDYLGADMVRHIMETVGSAELDVFHFHKQIVKANWKLFVDNNDEPYHNFLHVFNRNNARSSSGTAYRNGHNFGRASTPVDYTKFRLDHRDTHLFPGAGADGIWHMIIFPDVLLITRGTVLRIDRMMPLAPGRTCVEWRGVGFKADTPDIRALRVRHHNQVWGPMGRNLPEDVAAVEEQWEQMRAGAVPYSIFAREDSPVGHDDATRRAWYQAWSQCMQRPAADPLGEPRARRVNMRRGG
jgi:phenylpropionate dioxygenase-like ring-hydroxylating dioxygenase large terminal subunit